MYGSIRSDVLRCKHCLKSSHRRGIDLWCQFCAPCQPASHHLKKVTKTKNVLFFCVNLEVLWSQVQNRQPNRFVQRKFKQDVCVLLNKTFLLGLLIDRSRRKGIAMMRFVLIDK